MTVNPKASQKEWVPGGEAFHGKIESFFMIKYNHGVFRFQKLFMKYI